MIELHRPEHDTFSDDIKDRFDSMVIAYRTVIHHAPPSSGNESENGRNVSQEEDIKETESGNHADLPYILDSGKLVSGQEEIIAWMEELDQELKQQRTISGDGCYIDPKSGRVC